jgi:hypothetical protein
MQCARAAMIGNVPKCIVKHDRKGALMLLYFTSDILTNVHVAISLIGILSGLVAMFGMFGGYLLPAWTTLFLWSTVATSLSGFPLPADRLLPSHIVAIVSLVFLAIAFFALYGRRLAGAWRWIYALSAVTALYLNAFVLVVQTFRRVPELRALAPTESEPPFMYAQLATLAVFVVFAAIAAIKLKPNAPDMAHA